MGFATALSGLKAASTNLQVTGNNIANSQTTGFKESRAEFADVYASSIGGVSKTQPGAGVRVTEVAQQFNQGNIESTQNSLDLAISGNGFFVLADSVAPPPAAAATGTTTTAPIPTSYTRNGAFQLNSEGNVVNSEGKYLLAFSPNAISTPQTFSKIFTPLTLDTSKGLPTATSKMSMSLNINGAATVPLTSPFDPTDVSSYNNTTSVTTYDSQGNAHIATTYYVKDPAAPSSWNAYFFLDNYGITMTDTAPASSPTPSATVEGLNVPGAPIPMTFTQGGLLDTVNGVVTTPVSANPTYINSGAIDLTSIDPNLNVSMMTLKLDFSGTTQFATPFSVNASTQNGLPAGNLTGIEVDGAGIVSARYSNGGSKPLGQVALARFPSNQALAKLGDTTWATTASSGQPVYDAAGSNNFGIIQSSALEGSNVDLSSQLVKLIVAQQAFQANSQTITTEKTLLETILRA
ncbi:MAG: flagellar hook protein FlgE [Methylobacter sp.]